MSVDVSGRNKRSHNNSRNSAANIDDMTGRGAMDKGPASMTVRDWVDNSFRSQRGVKSHLNYHPTERALQVNTILWKQVGKRESFLDPIIKKESKKVDLGKYSTHSNWGDSLKNSIT